MKQDLFRKESMDQLTRPDQLSDYIRVSTPATWVLLAAIILLLVGTCVWGVFGRLDTTVQGAAVSDGTALTAYFTEEDSAKRSEGMTVMVNGADHTITRIDHTPQQLSGDSDDLMLHVGSFDPGAWVLTVALDGGEPEGFYSAEAVIESIAPSKFVFN